MSASRVSRSGSWPAETRLSARPARSARSSARAPGTLEATAATGSPASSSACRFDPLAGDEDAYASAHTTPSTAVLDPSDDDVPGRHVAAGTTAQ